MTAEEITDPLKTRNWPLYWFASLDHALAEKNHEAAREAIHELARLGIEIRFLLPPAAVILEHPAFEAEEAP